MTNPQSIYFAAGWFTPAQKQAYDQALAAMNQNPSLAADQSYVPLAHPYKNLDVGQHPEYLKDPEWATATYKGDLLGIKQTDLVAAVYLPKAEDVGCGVEIGYAHALGKPVVLIIPDVQFGEPINLMAWGAADVVMRLSEMATYDFSSLTANFYPGAVY